MTHNDRQELPTKHKEREEQTNYRNNVDNCIHHFVRPQVGEICEESAERLLALLCPLPCGKGQQQLLYFFHEKIIFYIDEFIGHPLNLSGI